MAVVTPLNNFLGPEGDTVTADKHYSILNTRITMFWPSKRTTTDLWSHVVSPSVKSVDCRATDAGQTDAALHLCGDTHTHTHFTGRN